LRGWVLFHLRLPVMGFWSSLPLMWPPVPDLFIPLRVNFSPQESLFAVQHCSRLGRLLVNLSLPFSIRFPIRWADGSFLPTPPNYFSIDDDGRPFFQKFFPPRASSKKYRRPLFQVSLREKNKKFFPNFSYLYATLLFFFMRSFPRQVIVKTLPFILLPSQVLWEVHLLRFLFLRTVVRLFWGKKPPLLPLLSQATLPLFGAHPFSQRRTFFGIHCTTDFPSLLFLLFFVRLSPGSTSRVALIFFHASPFPPPCRKIPKLS